MWDEVAHVQQVGNSVRVTANAPRPVEMVAMAIRQRFDVPLCVEDAIFEFADDFRDASLTEPRLRKGTLVPSGGRLELVLRVGSRGETVRELVRAAEAQLPVRYRVEAEPARLVLVPVARRDNRGRMAPAIPLLDRKVSIPAGTRPVRESAALMVQQLSAQTGMTISCCESAVAGYPWGMQEAAYGAADRTARDVLRDLIRLAGGRRLWVSRCDSKFCFIDLN